jgi:hypothetical protein
VSFDIEAFEQLGRERLPGLVGIEIDEIEEGHVRMHLPLRTELLAPNTRGRSSPLRTRPAVTAASPRCRTGRQASRRSS